MKFRILCVYSRSPAASRASLLVPKISRSACAGPRENLSAAL
jgi:hypothetical protein